MTTGTVTGTFVDRVGGTDAAAVGQVTFAPSVPRLLDAAGDEIVLPDRVVCTLDSSGAFSTVLQATDDPALNPVDWTWSALVDVGVGRPWTFAFAVAGGSTQDLADIAPVPSSGGDAVIPVGVQAVVAGAGVAVDATDPQRPVVSASYGTAATKDVPASGDATSTQVVMGNDTRLSNARTPTSHAASHASAGSDPITPASIGAATSAQGVKADTAVQPGALATVATSGAYSDLTEVPSIPDPTDGSVGQVWSTDGSTGSWQDVAARDTLYTASVSGSVTIDYENGPVQELTLTGATTFSIATPSLSGVAAVLTLSVIQDGTGGRAVTWPAGVKWSQGFAPAFGTAAGDESVVTLVWSSSRGWRGFVSGVAMQVSS